MSQFFKLLFGSTLLAAAFSTAQADNNTTTFVGPTLQGSYTGWFSPVSGYTILGEVGIKNYRLNLTAGTLFDDRNRFKISAEYLRQKINYRFFSGTEQEWMQQYALGGDYQYSICSDFSCYIDVNAYYSHAPGEALNPEDVFVNINGIPTFLVTDNRHIAGSNAFGISPGVSFATWLGGSMAVNLNYDKVHYDEVYATDEIVNGFGGTIRLQQAITDYLGLGLVAAIRKPFNHYEASINWLSGFYNDRLGIGLFGAYTAGKSNLPNTWNAGISLNFIDCHGMPVAVKPLNYKNEFSNELCLTAAQPYGLVMDSVTPPQILSQRPAQLGPKLPIVNATFSGLSNGGTRS